MRYNCYYGLPHNLIQVKDFKDVLIEQCSICGKKFRWTKDYKGRTNNKEYLKEHIRNFAQPGGATKRIYNRIYKPERMIIKINNG